MGGALSAERGLCKTIIHPHKAHCSSWDFTCGYSGFISALKMYAPLYIWSSLVQTKFSPDLDHVLSKMIPAILRSSLFFGTVAGGFPFFVCFFSRLGIEVNQLTIFIAGFLGSLVGISVESERRRVELAVYVLNQALETSYKALMTRKWVPKIGQGSEIVLALSFAILSLFHKHKPENLANSAKSLMAIIIGTEDKPDKVEALVSKFYFWYKKKFYGTKLGPKWLFSEGVHKSCHHHHGFHEHLVKLSNDEGPNKTTSFSEIQSPTKGQPNNETAIVDTPIHTPQESPSAQSPSESPRSLTPNRKLSHEMKCTEEYKTRLCKHQGGCKSFCAIGGIKGFSLGVAIRFTFSLLPALAKFQNVTKLLFWKKILLKTFNYNSMMFAAFLSFISGGTRGMLCFLRLFRKTDDHVNTFLSGAFGGLATIFFSSTELSMYLVGKALESLFYFACEKGYSYRMVGGGRLLFSVSAGILFWASFFEPHTLRNSYLTFLYKASFGNWAVALNAFKGKRTEHLVSASQSWPNIKQAYDEWCGTFGNTIIRHYLGKTASM